MALLGGTKLEAYLVWFFLGGRGVKLSYNMDDLFKLHFRVKQPVIVFLMKVGVWILQICS